MTIFRRILAATAFTALVASSAMATTILTGVQTQSSGLQQTNDQTTSLVFAKFDPSLGVLTSVHFTLTGYEEAGFSFTDLSSSANTFTIVSNGTVILTAGGPTLIQALPTITQSGSVAANGTTSSPGYPARTLTNSITTPDTVYTDAPTLSLFNGPGSITLFTSAHTSDASSAQGDNQRSILTRYIGTATVQYDYFTSSTPEPATMALMGSALLGLGILRKKTRS
jgi:hypothetical protein